MNSLINLGEFLICKKNFKKVFLKIENILYNDNSEYIIIKPINWGARKDE